MTELQEILKTWRTLNGDQHDAVLATVVHVAGSAYRRPGARLLLLPDGRRIGSVSGGCLEGEIARKAWRWTESKPASLQVFDTTSQEDAIWGFGLGCNGVVQVLMERASSPGTTQLLEFLEMTQSLREPAVVATVVRPSANAELRAGERLLVERGNVKGELAAHHHFEELAACANVVLRRRRNEFMHSDFGDIFIEYVPPSPSLIILGAGHDAQALVTTAKEVGFRVTVADARSAYLKQNRFPDADTVALLSDDHAIRDILVGPDMAVVLMTHNYQLDARLLPSVLAAGPRYLGLLGPRARAERLFEDLQMAMPEYVNAPVGLDIGGDTPKAVALSIVAEIHAVFEGRPGSMLKHTRGAIHSSNMEWWLLCTRDGRVVHPSGCDAQD